MFGAPDKDNLRIQWDEAVAAFSNLHAGHAHEMRRNNPGPAFGGFGEDLSTCFPRLLRIGAKAARPVRLHKLNGMMDRISDE
jgi:hypothetical protein